MPISVLSNLCFGLSRFTKVAVAFIIVFADSKVRSQTALEPEQGGVDFLLQGEYMGKIGAVTPYAAQVVVLGSGQFQAIFLEGGLPGQGWNGTSRTEVQGRLQAEQAVFSGNGFSATLAANGLSLVGINAKGEAFSLHKIFRESPTLMQAAPLGANVLFDGRDVTAWQEGTVSLDSRKLLKPEGISASSGAITKLNFQSFTLHLEFRIPFRGQKRGNSGIYLQGRNEIQILDSFGANLNGTPDSMAPKRECGAFFEYFSPTLNMSYPPLSWQTFDIEFTAAVYDATKKIKIEPAYASVWFNGVLIHDRRALVHSTLLGDPQGPEPGPLRFQAYGDSVYFRNIWVKEITSSFMPKKHITKTNGKIFNLKSWDWVRLDGRRIQGREKIRLSAAGV